MTMEEPLASARLQGLRRDLLEDDRAALDRFWQEVQRHGAPLIERLPGDDAHSHVTFLWRETRPVGNVAVISDLEQARTSDRTPPVMARLDGTDPWYLTYRLPNDLRTTYELSPGDARTPLAPMPQWNERTSTFQPDPLNPRRYRVNLPNDRWIGSPEKYLSVLELPDALPQPYVEPRPDVPRGMVHLHQIRSKILDNERQVWVYVPPGYGNQVEPYGLLVLFDGAAYLHMMHAATTLDNLQAESRLPPLVAVFVNNATATSRSTELGCSESFTGFLAEELLPWLRSDYQVTDDPSRSVIGGTSLGGLAAVFTAVRHPELFGNVLSQSGAFSWSRPNDPEPERIKHELAAGPLLPLRFFLDVGLLEDTAFRPDRPSLLQANRNLRAALMEKGYSLTYLEFNGAHNYICWQGTLADGLIALLRLSPA
jgi:enterochelin esterase family protein